MEHIANKTSPLAITRIRHVWREGQNNNFDFIKKNNFSHAFKSGCSRRCLDKADAQKLHEDYSRVTSKSTFDEQLRNFQLLHEIYLSNSEWACSCPYFMQCGMCKHMISFNINALNQDVSPQYDATALCSRKKWGRPKKASSALHMDAIKEVITIDEDSDDEYEDTKICGAAA